MTDAPRVDFVVSNDRHHVANIAPVIERLRGDVTCRVLSLCEFRGLPTPPTAAMGCAVVRVVPARLRSPSAGASAAGGSRGTALRTLARKVAWEPLRARLEMLWRAPPDLVVVPNDAAYPMDRICGLLTRKGVPFVLLQEGIRFPLPGISDQDAYGTGGAAALAAWGEASATYFTDRGVPRERVHVVGSPRFDAVAATDWRTAAATLRAGLDLDGPLVGYVSNPIDDQGFCTHREKMALFRSFLDAARPLIVGEGLGVAVKLHSRESPEAFRDTIRERGLSDSRVQVLADAPLYPTLAACDAVVVLASTVGLEAMLVDTPVGVLELPGAGFVHDYVQCGAASPLHGDRRLEGDVRMLLAQDDRHVQRRAYVQRNLANLGNAFEACSELLLRMLDGR